MTLSAKILRSAQLNKKRITGNTIIFELNLFSRCLWQRLMIIIRECIFMFDEVTQVDIDKMKEELEYRISVLRPKILEEVVFTRSFGDLSENAEYHAAKRERGKNESRIRYLRNMIKTAVLIDPKSNSDEVGLFDTVEYYVEEDDVTESVRIVTTLRQNSLERLISPESPMGKAIMGKKTGDRVYIKVSDEYGYFIVIRKITKGVDDKSLEIRKF